MKRPKKPTIPYKPHIPEAPKQTMLVWSPTEIMQISPYNDDKMTVLEWSTMIRAELERHGFPADTRISFGVEQNYDTVEGITVLAGVTKEVPNPHYEAQQNAWIKDAKYYAKQQDEYEKAMLVYKERLEKYHVDIEKYNEFVKKDEIERLEARLKELKKGEIP